MRAGLALIPAVAVVAALAGAGAGHWLKGAGGPVLEDGGPVDAPAPFTLRDLAGEPRTVTEWNGRVLLLNFWATWCPPCVREMPLFVELQDELGGRGLQVVAVAIDERDPVQVFVDEHAIDFPVLVGGEDAIGTARDYGNRHGALPYTVVIDRNGAVAGRFPGELTRERIEGLLRELL